MAVEFLARRLYDKFVPVDENGLVAFESIKPNAIVKVLVTVPRKLNTDEITDEQRNVAQNRLYWMWLTDMEHTTNNEMAGHDQNYWHRKMKFQFLMRIYERDSQEYAELVSSMRRLKELGMQNEYQAIARFVTDNTSTTKASVHQFAEYLTRIQNYCMSKGIWLRTDEGLLQLALYMETAH